jgi:hypothetical protein
MDHEPGREGSRSPQGDRSACPVGAGRMGGLLGNLVDGRIAKIDEKLSRFGNRVANRKPQIEPAKGGRRIHAG